MATEKEVFDLQSEIDKLDDSIVDMAPEQLDAKVRTISGSSTEAFGLRRKRKEVRYKLYLLRSAAEGKASATHLDPEFKKHFETQPQFKGWRFFGDLWDVSLYDPMEVVGRDHSEIAEWRAIVQAKFPQITTDGRVVYPDISVKQRIADAEKKLRSAG